MSFGKKISPRKAQTKSAKLVDKLCFFFTEETEFPFFEIPIFRLCPWTEEHSDWEMWLSLSFWVKMSSDLHSCAVNVWCSERLELPFFPANEHQLQDLSVPAQLQSCSSNQVAPAEFEKVIYAKWKSFELDEGQINTWEIICDFHRTSNWQGIRIIYIRIKRDPPVRRNSVGQIFSPLRTGHNHSWAAADEDMNCYLSVIKHSYVWSSSSHGRELHTCRPWDFCGCRRETLCVVFLRQQGAGFFRVYGNRRCRIFDACGIQLAIFSNPLVGNGTKILICFLSPSQLRVGSKQFWSSERGCKQYFFLGVFASKLILFFWRGEEEFGKFVFVETSGLECYKLCCFSQKFFLQKLST